MASFKSSGGVPIFERSIKSSARNLDLLGLNKTLFHPKQIVRFTTKIKECLLH
jgi:hypothetical protein